MSKNTAMLAEFDPAEYLDSPESIQAYINEAVETGDAAFISESLGVVARARGMTDLASQTGLSRETLYRTLSSKGNPSLKTLLSIVAALGLSFSFTTKHHA
ncbi:addiction module antidote protein [Vibrio diabolicus]|uniref:addiction module antidote protein n=1 Tax=Vibrio diabolicus TaxID=50719 RepID=UPI003D7DBFF0